MLYRKHPTCPKCGEEINGKYHDRGHNFIGDTWYGWDWDNHRCRLGIKYFIERMDTREWWPWTNDPMKAKMFDTKEDAQKYLMESTEISARIQCEVTEHEFVSDFTPREPTITDALLGYKK